MVKHIEIFRDHSDGTYRKYFTRIYFEEQGNTQFRDFTFDGKPYQVIGLIQKVNQEELFRDGREV